MAIVSKSIQCGFESHWDYEIFGGVAKLARRTRFKPWRPELAMWVRIPPPLQNMCPSGLRVRSAKS